MRGKFFLLILGFFVLLISCRASKTRVTYLTLHNRLSPQDQQILRWLKSDTRLDVHHESMNLMVEPANGVVWVHIPDSLAFTKWTQAEFDKIGQWYQGGIHLLCTNYAALIPARCGIESNKPQIRVIKVKNYWNFDKRGFQSRMGHPIFKELFGGAFFWDLDKDSRLHRIGYFDDAFPKQGNVVGVEKSYIFIHAKNRLVIEYKDKKPQRALLAVGAMVDFSPHNRLKYKLEKFIENSLLYLDGRLPGKTTYWVQNECKAKKIELSNLRLATQSAETLQALPQSGLLFKRKATDNFYDLAGRRTLVMGAEKGGIDEVWVHPFRIARDVRLGVIHGKQVYWLNTLPCTIEIRPESIVRTYQTPAGELKETLFASLRRPGMVMHLQAPEQKPLKLLIKFRSDLRWMWPYDENALGDVLYGYDARSSVLTVKDRTGAFYCLFGANAKPVQTTSGAYANINWKNGALIGKPTELNQVYHGAVYELNAQNHFGLNYCLVGTDQGKGEAVQTFDQLMQHPLAEYRQMVRHYDEILRDYVIIRSPDSTFNTLWKWAIVGTDRFFIHTPNLGKALVAGFGTSNRGWNGGSKNSGRPGYAWYFGRDACWSSFAIDDYGDVDLVKHQLQFFQKYQDLSGKIFHEVSTSGVVHFDAADATPLYVILAAHYLRASGDLAFIRQSWPHIKKAMDFLYSTDTDGDGLIENKNVGHGWVEGGKLWGSNPTLYLCGLWAQTLKDAAYMAKMLNDENLSRQYAADAQKVISKINTDFWNPKDQFYYYGKIGKDKYNPQKTVLPAVPMYYNLLDADKVQTILAAYASDDFSSDWGVRIISARSPIFNPVGYHEGSVWPLFTGWTSLAEFEYGNAAQGFRHIRNNMDIKKHWALGFVEEVMNGVAYKPDGVCPHQCWSETNVIDPAIHGMIGWRPFALQNKAKLMPRFSLNWDSVSVRNLRVGYSRLQFTMKRGREQTNFVFQLQQGPAVTVMFYPQLPDGMTIDSISLNGKLFQPDTARFRGLMEKPIRFKLEKRTTIRLQHHGGIGVIPSIANPKPGDASKGYRVIKTDYHRGVYAVTLQGKAGTEAIFELKTYDRPVAKVKGASVVGQTEQGLVKINVRFPNNGKKFPYKTVRLVLDTKNGL